jgi:hypothetical protein
VLFLVYSLATEPETEKSFTFFCKTDTFRAKFENFPQFFFCLLSRKFPESVYQDVVVALLAALPDLLKKVGFFSGLQGRVAAA